MNKQKKAFTLVELVVSAAVIIILGTIGIAAFLPYLETSRDSGRVAQMTSLYEGLIELELRGSRIYPDDYLEIKTNSGIIAYQGYIGKNLLDSISYTSIGKDPKTKKYYTVYMTENLRNFQILGHLERNDVSQGSLFKQSHANSYLSLYPYVTGKPLGVLTGTGADENIPIQDLRAGSVNVETTNNEYRATFSKTQSVSGTGSTLVILKSIVAQGGNVEFSCNDILKESQGTYGKSGVYLLKKSDGSFMYVYCDMITQGGGWTLAARWDSDHPSYIRNLPADALRSYISLEDMTTINQEGVAQSATLDIRNLIDQGAQHFMHASLDATDNTYQYLYFSEIYQSVRDYSDNIFNTQFDTNTSESIAGTCVNDTSKARRDRWFDSNFHNMDVGDADGASYDYLIDGGEAQAMFTQAGQDGAVYASGNNSTCANYGKPYVQWAFYGKDNSQPSYGCSPFDVGTACTSGVGNKPKKRFNLMFIR